MEKNYSFFFITILFFFTYNSFAQDTINLLNGKQIIAKSVTDEANNTLLKYDILIKGNVKQKKIDKIDVFSIDYSDNTHKIFYKTDSSFGLSLSIVQMEHYIKGEQYAINNYKAPWVTACGLCAGFAPTIYYFNFYGLLAPAVYGTAMGIITPKIKHIENISPEFLNNKHFLDGYREAATKKKLKNALFGSIGGVAIAVITTTVLYNIHK